MDKEIKNQETNESPKNITEELETTNNNQVEILFLGFIYFYLFETGVRVRDEDRNLPYADSVPKCVQ